MKIVGNLRNRSDPARELSLHDRTSTDGHKHAEMARRKMVQGGVDVIQRRVWVKVTQVPKIWVCLYTP